MNDVEYIALAEALYARIEDILDGFIEQQIPLDYETSSGVITVLCEDTDTQVIISRQRAVHQIWVAAKSGGFHCDYVNKEWFCDSTKESLQMLLSRVCSEQSSDPVTFPDLGSSV